MPGKENGLKEKKELQSAGCSSYKKRIFVD